MFYLAYAIFCLGVALLQSSHLRATKGVVATRRRITYLVLAWSLTAVEIFVGLLLLEPSWLGAVLFLPIYYVVNRGIQLASLRLRYTFRLGLALAVAGGVFLPHYVRPLFTR